MNGDLLALRRVKCSVGGCLNPFLNATEIDRKTHVDRSNVLNPANLTALSNDEEQEQGRRLSGRLSAEWKQSLAGGSEWLINFGLQGETENTDKSVFKRALGGQANEGSREEVQRDEREFSLRLKGKHLLGERHFISAGSDFRLKRTEERQNKWRNGLELTADASSQSDITDDRYTLWAQDELQIDETQVLTPGLRWQAQFSEIRDGAGQQVHANYQGLHPSLHYLWQLNSTLNKKSSKS